MPLIPIRGVGDAGVIADLPSYDLPINSWAYAKNIRFHNGAIYKSGAFKLLNEPPTFTGTPAGIVDGSLSGDQGYIVIPYTSGPITQIKDGTQTNVSPTVGWTAYTSRLTSGRVGGVTFINNADNKPLYRASPLAPLFAYLPGWVATDRALTLRTYKDYVVALGVTKVAAAYPNMVKWSDAVQAGAPPANWDTASLSSHAGETVLNDARGKLIDGLALGNAFILYGSEETYVMNFIGTPLIFAFDKLFNDLGVIAQDCAVEIDGKHYVFGTNGIYLHDGMSKISLSDRKITKRLFSRLDQSKVGRCFVFRNPNRSEILFCYPSKAIDVKWPLSGISGCNEAAVFNIITGTWSFVDLPSLTFAVMASMPTVSLWSDLGTWDSLGGSWRSYEGSEPAMPVVLSTGNGAGSKLYFYDDAQDGYLPNVVDTIFLTSGIVETQIRDSDEMGGSLATLKLIREVHPQILVSSPYMSVQVSVGVSQNPYADLIWSPAQTFYPGVGYKCDFRSTGKYISIKFEIPPESDAKITGYDMDIEVLAKR